MKKSIFVFIGGFVIGFLVTFIFDKQIFDIFINLLSGLGFFGAAVFVFIGPFISIIFGIIGGILGLILYNTYKLFNSKEAIIK